MDATNRIKYFSYYGCNDEANKRNNSPAADTKLDYIISVLNNCGYAVDHISRASSSCNHYIHTSIEKRGINTLRYFASLKDSPAFHILNRVFMDFQLFFWCLWHLKYKEQIIVYHSLGYDFIFILLCKLKHLRIIGEIEEIYQDVHVQRRFVAKNEYRFIEICQKYIFPTYLLDTKLNKLRKPSIVVHGVYSTEHIGHNKFNDGKIHVVYGGTLDPNKGGAAAAAAAAEFLPSNFHIHICGFGDASQIKTIITDIMSRSSAEVTFEGELKDKDYRNFIQRCDIGLSTQNPVASFNSTSFPSKILMYLSNGLNVVSIRIPAIEQSAIANCIAFYDVQNPKTIAEAIILSANTAFESKSKEILEQLNKSFINDLNVLISL